MFSVISNLSTEQSHLSEFENTNCENLKGYFLSIGDPQSNIIPCDWFSFIPPSKTYPIFIYTLPDKIWNQHISQEDNQAVQFNQQFPTKSIRYADELRIYAKPVNYNPIWSLDQNTIRSPLILINTESNISFVQLWKSNLQSPTNIIDLTNTDWFRSPILSKLLSKEINFQIQKLTFTLLKPDKTMVVQLEFQIPDSAQPNSWFKSENLLSAHPWSLDQLRSMDFIQFGTYQSSPSIELDDWKFVDFWIGQFDVNCKTLLIILNNLSFSQMPKCLFKNNSNLLDVNYQIYQSGFNENIDFLDRIKPIGQISIWYN